MLKELGFKIQVYGGGAITISVIIMINNVVYF